MKKNNVSFFLRILISGLMKNTLLFFFACLICTNLKAQQIQRLIITYSNQDCDFCNGKIYDVLNIKNVDKTIVFREEDKLSKDLSSLINELNSKKISTVFSDSLYNVLNGGLASKVFLYDDKMNLVKEESLKTFNLPSDYSNNESSFSLNKSAFIRLSNSCIYCFERHDSYILYFDKKNRKPLPDTLGILNDTFTKAAFLEAFQSEKEYEDYVYFVNKDKKFPGKPKILNLFPIEDKLYVLCQFYHSYYIDTMGQKAVMVDPFLILKEYTNNVYTKTYSFAMNDSSCSKDACYYPFVSYLFEYNNVLYTTVLTTKYDTTTFLFTSLQAKDNKLEMAKFIPYFMPKEQVPARHNLSTFLSSGKYVGYVYYPILYDLESKTLLKLPLRMAKNVFTKEEFETKNISVNAQMISLYCSNDTISVIYNNEDTIYFAKYKKDKNKLITLADYPIQKGYANADKLFFRLNNTSEYFYYSKTHHQFMLARQARMTGVEDLIKK